MTTSVKTCLKCGENKTPPRDGIKTDTQGAPDRIWLQLHGDGDPEDGPTDCASGEVSWCWEQIFEQDIEYIRADLAAERERELVEALQGAFDIVETEANTEENLAAIRKCSKVLAAHEQEKDDGNDQ
jgi:hypothetical protein